MSKKKTDDSETIRKDKRYEIKVSLGNGKRRSVYGATKKEAEKKAKKLKEEATKYDLSNVNYMTLKTYMNIWLYKDKSKTVEPKSFDRIRQVAENQIYPYIGDIRVSVLNADDIQKMLDAVSENKSYSTTKKAYYVMKDCMTTAHNRGHIIRNPMVDVYMPKMKKFPENSKKNVFVYTDEQIESIIKTIGQKYSNDKYMYRYGPLLIFLLNTGLRVGEALYLKQSDVDLEERWIYIHGTTSEHKKSDGTGSVIEDKDRPKSKSSVRRVYLNDTAYDALVTMIEMSNKTKNADNRVICTRNGKTVRESSIHRCMTAVLKRCGITEYKEAVHSLRHSFATLLIQMLGKTPDVAKRVSKILGHYSVFVTMDYYFGVSEESQKDIVKELDKKFIGKK